MSGFLSSRAKPLFKFPTLKENASESTMWHNEHIRFYFATPETIMSEKATSSKYSFPQVTLDFDTLLADVLPAAIAQPLAAFGLLTAEDLYECVAATGATWFRNVLGISASCATELMYWFADCGKNVGEVTERFYLPGAAPTLRAEESSATATELTGELVSEAEDEEEEEEEEDNYGIVPLDLLSVPSQLNGEAGINRAPQGSCSLEARNDLEAIWAWLTARASNENTRGNYRKEAERFLLWCLIERRTALSSIKAGDASLYLRWLEQLGRMDEATWSRTWKVPQNQWIGPKNMPRLSPAWRPFNGPLMSSSRHNAIVVVRQLFNFLKKTGYLIFNPFDQVSPKVPLLKGEGVPQAFADRSLTDEQWQEIVSHIALLPEGWPRERMKLILMMGKSLGMRASEMIDARADWLVERRLGNSTRLAIEVVGKGAKVRRLPLNAEQIDIINAAMAARGLPQVGQIPPDEPLLINLGRGRNANASLSRAGLYSALSRFFDLVANEVATTRPMDAAKLRAASTHWLRHTFAVTALSKISVNVVQHAMGHASVATTGRYLAPEDETLSQAMDQLKAL